MRAARILSALALAVVLAALLAAPASAIPVFARKYGFACTMCHSAMPRLNDFGQRFRTNGYQLPGKEAEEKTVLEAQAPIALRTAAGLTGTRFNKAAAMPDQVDLVLSGLDLLSAGVLGRNIGYQLVYTPQIAGQPGVAEQEGSLEMASIVFTHLRGSTWANLRVGRFEPAYVVSSVKRQLTVTTPDLYDAPSPGPSISETQTGLELAGYGRQPFRYAVGWLGGAHRTDVEGSSSSDWPADFYGRAAWILGAGEGQTAGQRVGVTGYTGVARAGTGERKGYWRVGPDVSLNAGYANLTAQWMFVHEDGAFYDLPSGVSWTGGFVEGSVMPVTNAVLFGRWDRVDERTELANAVQRFTGGARFYPVDNVALHAELSNQRENTHGDAGDPSATFYTARVDFAF
jgi:hypothetical protein